MGSDALPEEWEIIRQWLPEDLDRRAREQRFTRRNRGLQDSERWLRLILMHAAGGLSLEQTTVRASELGLAKVSPVALFKRLRRAEGWLRDVCGYLLVEQQRRLGRCHWPSRYRVRAIDATNVLEPGKTGSAWRLHYSIRLPELICDHYELTDQHGGEKLGRFSFQKGELVLADRGYSHRAGLRQVLDSGADLLMRWHPKTLPMQATDGGELDLLGRLRSLPKTTPKEWKVEFSYQHKSYPLRLCAIRKSRVAADRARQKALRKAQKNGSQAESETLELAAFTLILTSLPESFSTRQVLELYRSRWQVELAFKRLKSLLSAGHVPKKDDPSAHAWMQAKILTSLLLERLLLEADIFSPWGYEL